MIRHNFMECDPGLRSKQVIGRVHGEDSMRVVERLNTTAVGLNDEPVQAMRVSDCGPTDSQVVPRPTCRGHEMVDRRDERGKGRRGLRVKWCGPCGSSIMGVRGHRSFRNLYVMGVG